MRNLKQSSAAQGLTFLLVSSSDHITPVLGAAPTVKLSKAGAAFADPAGAISEIGYGWYRVAGNATDTNTLGSLILHATATGADPTDREYAVVAFDPLDSAGLGLSRLDAAISTIPGLVRTAMEASGTMLDTLFTRATALWTRYK